MPPRRSGRKRSLKPPLDSAAPAEALRTTGKTSKRKRPPAQIIYVPTVRPQDVLMGRGPAVNGHQGNVTFRTMVKTYIRRYLNAGKTDKTHICQEIVDRCKSEQIHFLEKDDSNGQWFHISEHTARTKAAQTIQDIIKRRQKAGRSPNATDEEDTAMAESSEPASSQGRLKEDSDDEPFDAEGSDNLEQIRLPDLPVPSMGYGTDATGLHSSLESSFFAENRMGSPLVVAAAAGSGSWSPNTPDSSSPPEVGRRPQAQLRPAPVPSYLRRQLSIEHAPQSDDESN